LESRRVWSKGFLEIFNEKERSAPPNSVYTQQRSRIFNGIVGPGRSEHERSRDAACLIGDFFARSSYAVDMLS
jgi:hypothetical protein